MTEQEKHAFIAGAVQRAPGKRQIKPSAALINLEVFGNDDEEDDEDFVAKSDRSSEESESGSDESSSEEDEEGGSGSETSAGDTEDRQVKQEPEDTADSKPICTICLNLHGATKNETPMTCDGCGLVVHETCYLPDVTEDTDSVDSGELTEPWFCEPCIYGLKEPPHCELCPSRFGAFKRSDIGGRWVHLLCALYTQNVTFGDVDNLMAISWQELDHRQFGRKSCSACSDRLQARTGIVTNCDVGLCKEYFHITCAHKLGYLVDNTHNNESFDEPGESAELEPRYIYCKAHSNSDAVRLKRRAYQRFIVQEEKRIAVMHLKVLNDRERRKIQKAYARSQKKFESLVGVTIGWPDANLDYQNDKKVRRSRQLHTSARYLELFQEKAELNDVDKDHFQQEFLRIKGDQLAFLAPGFSREFIEYFEQRETKTIPAEQRRLETVKEENEAMKQRQDRLHDEYKQAESEAARVHERAEHLRALTLDLYETLVQWGAKKKKPAVLEKINRVNLASPKRNRKTQKKNGALVSSPTSSSRKSASLPGKFEDLNQDKDKKEANHKLALHTCDECKKTSDQHLLVDCDECHTHYHIGCLDPPLDRLPKTSKYGWICSRCNESSGDEEPSVKAEHHSDGDEEASNDGATSTRRLRQRCDHTKARKLAEAEEQRRAYKSAIASGAAARRGSAKRKSDLKSLNSTPTKEEPTEPPSPKKNRASAQSQNTPPNSGSLHTSPNGRTQPSTSGAGKSKISERMRQAIMILDDFEL